MLIQLSLFLLLIVLILSLIILIKPPKKIISPSSRPPPPPPPSPPPLPPSPPPPPPSPPHYYGKLPLIDENLDKIVNNNINNYFRTIYPLLKQSDELKIYWKTVDFYYMAQIINKYETNNKFSIGFPNYKLPINKNIEIVLNLFRNKIDKKYQTINTNYSKQLKHLLFEHFTPQLSEFKLLKQPF